MLRLLWTFLSILLLQNQVHPDLVQLERDVVVLLAFDDAEVIAAVSRQ